MPKYLGFPPCKPSDHTCSERQAGAEGMYRRILEEDAGNVDALCNLGALQSESDPKAAEVLYAQVKRIWIHSPPMRCPQENRCCNVCKPPITMTRGCLNFHHMYGVNCRRRRIRPLMLYNNRMIGASDRSNSPTHPMQHGRAYAEARRLER